MLSFVFIDIKQFMNSSWENLVKKLSDDDFKLLTQEFGSENLQLLKQRDAYPYEYMDRFSEGKLPDKTHICRWKMELSKMEQLMIRVKK